MICAPCDAAENGFVFIICYSDAADMLSAAKRVSGFVTRNYLGDYKSPTHIASDYKSEASFLISLAMPLAMQSNFK